jgi:hypothetical protein
MWGIIREKVWLENSLSHLEGGNRGGSRYRKVVEAMTHIEATGKCVRGTP